MTQARLVQPSARIAGAVLLLGALLLGAGHAGAQRTDPPEPLRIVVAGSGALHQQVSALGEQQGMFRRHGLVIALRQAPGSAEALAAVAAGNADVAVGVDMLAAVAAFAQGAPLRLIGSALIGSDAFWYVSARSPIRSLKDAAGRKLAHAGTGTASNLMALGLQELAAVKFQLVATGDGAATLAQVMEGKVDVGWGAPPMGAAELADERIRILARGNDLPGLARRSTHVIVSNAATLDAREDALRRYRAAYAETITWLFSTEEPALAAYAGWAGVPAAAVPRVRAAFGTAETLRPEPVLGLETTITEGVSARVLPAPFAAAQVGALLRPLASPAP